MIHMYIDIHRLKLCRRLHARIWLWSVLKIYLSSLYARPKSLSLPGWVFHPLLLVHRGHLIFHEPEGLIQYYFGSNLEERDTVKGYTRRGKIFLFVSLFSLRLFYGLQSKKGFGPIQLVTQTAVKLRLAHGARGFGMQMAQKGRKNIS